MLEEKRKDLKSERQRRLLGRLVEELSQTERDLYYRPTSEIASFIKKYIDSGGTLLEEDKLLLRPLSRRDIEVLLSLH